MQHFDKAIALDPEFASAELARANAAGTAKEFFEHLNKAVALADKASEGERLLILANQAGANGEAVKQKEYFEKLVAAYPNDERAHFNLGAFDFGQQDYPQAIEHLKRAPELAPNYSPAYNMLGYAYRQAGDYANAEQAFRKYIELIPNDPNPYDSYAELLLKMGKFDESIAQYRKALMIDPHFVPSHFGIAADLLYMGKPADATAELQKMADLARNDGELRTALFGMAVVASDSGKLDKAVQAMDKEYAVAEKKNDVAAMAADLQAKGNIIAEMAKYDVAAQQFDRSLQMVESSSLSQEIKDNAKLLHHYNLCALAIGKKDYAAAKTHAEEYRQGAEASKNPAQLKLAHELAGRIALAQKDYDDAIKELEQVQPAGSPQPLSPRPGLSGQGRCRAGTEVLRRGCRVQFVAGPELRFCSSEGAEDGGRNERIATTAHVGTDASSVRRSAAPPRLAVRRQLFRPSGAHPHFTRIPRACALGCILAPLRGLVHDHPAVSTS